jgi:pimeloyl-ACP methyl ester carboxylesterase
MGAPIAERRLELAGFETRALEVSGSGPPLVLLHGYADSADAWRPLLDELAGLRRGAIALDMPGFGTASRLDRDAPPPGSRWRAGSGSSRARCCCGSSCARRCPFPRRSCAASSGACTGRSPSCGR